MSNDTDHTPEVDQIQEHLAKLIEALERVGGKVTGFFIQFEGDEIPEFGSRELTTEEELKIKKAFSEAGLEAPVGEDRSSDLRPGDDQETEMDDFLALIPGDDPLH